MLPFDVRHEAAHVRVAELPLAATARAVQVAVLMGGPDVVLLTAVGAVTMRLRALAGSWCGLGPLSGHRGGRTAG